MYALLGFYLMHLQAAGVEDGDDYDGERRDGCVCALNKISMLPESQA